MTAGTIGLVGLIVVLNAAVLAVCQVPLTLQLGVGAYTAYLTVLGSALLRPLRARLPDRVTYYLLSCLCGIVLLFAVTFVLLHRPVLAILHLDGQQEAVLAANGLCTLVAALVYLRTRRAAARPPTATRAGRVLPALLLLAAVLASATYYGKLNAYLHRQFPETNRALPDWAQHSDARVQIVRNTMVLIEDGYPPEKLAHRGLQQTALSYAYVVGGGEVLERAIKIVKTLAFPCYFALLYLTFIIAVVGFGAGGGSAVLATVAVVLFAPISTAPLTSAYTSYRAGIGSGGAFYHNATQLFSVPIALGGIVLLLESVRTRLDGRFVWGCLLVAGSFFFKPSAFTVIAPTIVLLLPLFRREERGAAVAGVLILLCVPALWLTYPAVFGTTQTALDVHVEPFVAKMLASRSVLPAALRADVWIWGVAIVVGSFAAFVPLLVDRTAALARYVWVYGAPRLEDLRRRRHFLLLVLPAVLGVAAVLLLVDGHRRGNSNFGWGAATGLVLFMPVFVTLVAARSSPVLRRATWVLLALHLWSGLQHLVHLVLMNSLRSGWPR